MEVIPPKSLSDYKQQFIPNKILQSFGAKKLQSYLNYENKPQVKFTQWNDYENIVGYLYELRRKYPKLVEIIEIGQTAQKRSLLVIKISPIQGRTYDRIFIEGGIHANEWISPNAVLCFIDSLVKNWKKLPHYMTTKTWLILPLANPDGFSFARSKKTNRMWRKNCRPNINSQCKGVDLNRNFGIGFDLNEIEDPCNNEYKGKTPFSEKETKAIRDYLLPQKAYLKAYIAFHSYGQEIRYLWSYSTPIDNKQRVKEVVKEAIASINSTAGKGKLNKYQAVKKPIEKLFGLARDWARKEFKIPYSFTVELRDQGKKGFKLSPKQTPKVGIDIYSCMDVIAKAIYNDYNDIKKRSFITQDFNILLQRQSHLYHRKKLF